MSHLMAMPPEIRARAEEALAAFCRKHSSAAVADQLRYDYSVSDATALLIEQRPSFMNRADWASKPLAKFRYSVGKHVWTLYWFDSSERWHRVSGVKAAADIETLLDAVVRDPSGVFWS